MNIQREFMLADIEELERKIGYCDGIIKKTAKTKMMWQKRLKNKRRLLE